jgi:hypothetical protein
MLSINGTTLICNTTVYSIPNLPTGVTVTWSIPSSAGNVLQLSQNTPTTNQLTITNQDWYTVSTTLTAVITGPGIINPITLTKTIANDNDNSPYIPYSYSQDGCTFYNVYHPAQNGTITSNSSPVFVHQGCTVYVDLSLGTGRTVNFIPTSSDPASNPIIWYYAGSTLYFQLPYGSGGVPFTFKITGDGACYQKNLLFFTYSNNGNASSGYSLLATPNPVSNVLNVTVQQAVANAAVSNGTSGITTVNNDTTAKNRPLALADASSTLKAPAESANSANFWQISLIDINGRLIKTINSVQTGQHLNIPVKGLSSGIYLLRATREKEYITQKIIIGK